LFLEKLFDHTFSENMGCFMVVYTKCARVVFSGNDSQVCKQYIGRVTLAKERGDAQEATESQAAWLEKARHFLGKRKASGQVAGADPPPQKKFYRTKSAQWGVTLNSILKTMTGRDLDWWRVPEDTTLPAADWPYLGISPDQGPDGFCFLHYLVGPGRVNAQLWWDPSHGVWRDQERASKLIGLRGFNMLLVVAQNLGHGPWDSASRYAQMTESSKEYLDNMASSCPLLEMYLPQLCKNYDISPVEYEDEVSVKQAVMQAMRDDWNSRHKGTQTKLCRFANGVDRAKDTDHSWHTFLITVIYLGFQTGVLHPDKVAIELPKPTAAGDADPGSGAGSAVKRGNDSIRKFRSHAKNNVQLVANLLLDPMSRTYNRILWKLVQPIREWYGQQSAQLRSADALAKWVQEQIAGGLNSPLGRTWALLGDVEVLDALDLTLVFGDFEKSLGRDHPVLATQDRIAHLAGEYIRHLVASRCKRMLYITTGLVGQQARFLDDNLDKRQEMADELLELQAAYRIAQRRTEAFWKKVCGRCVLHQVPYQQIIKILESHEGKCDNTLVDHVRQRLRGIGQSKCSEDSVNVGRRMESAAGNCLQGTAKVLYRNLIDKGLASNVYKFDEPAWRETIAPVGVQSELQDRIFLPSFADTPPWVRRVRSTALVPKWFSPSADSVNVSFAEIKVLLEAKRTGKWAEVAKGSLLSMCANAPCLALRGPSSPTWYIALTDVCLDAALGWPCEAVYKGESLLSLRPKADGECTWLLVYSREWKACTFEWASPLHQVIVKAIPAVQMERDPSALCLVVSQPKDLLEEGATQAFWQLKKTQVTWICKFIEMQVQQDWSLFQTLEALIARLLPRATPDQVLDILSKRMVSPAIWDDVMTLEEADDLVDEKDKVQLQDMVKATLLQKEEVKEFRKSWVAKRSAVAAGGGASSSKSKKKKPPPAWLSTGTRTKITPMEYPTNGITKEVAMSMCPSPVSLYEDTQNARWQVYFRGVGSRSRSWFLHGYDTACKLVLQWAWLETLSRAGVGAAACPIKGLLDDAAPRPAQPAQDSSDDEPSAQGCGAASSSKD